MAPKWFKVKSKYLSISWVGWFDIVINMLGFLATSHAPITGNCNLSNKPYIFLGLLENLSDLLIPVYYRSIILGIFDTFYPSQYGIPLGVLDDCWAKQTLFKFDVFITTSEAGCSITSEKDATSLVGIYCSRGTDCNDIPFYGSMLGYQLGVLLIHYQRSGVNQVSLR